MNAETPTLEKLVVQAELLSSLDRIRLVERLVAGIERDMAALAATQSETARLRAWQVTVERTAGVLADDPIERPPQGDFEQRDPIP